MPLFDLTCPNQHERFDVMLKLGERPPCSVCAEPTETLWRTKASGVIGDDIPGGLTIEHGVCHANGAPRTFYSKAEILRAAKERGLEPFVRHSPDPKSGGDSSSKVSRWASADITDYDDPAVKRRRQEEMASHCGMSFDEFMALRAAPVHRGITVVGSADDALVSQILTEAGAR